MDNSMDSINSFKEQQLSDLIKSINSTLLDISVDDIPKLPERIFAQVFIPVFAGEESIYGATIQTWINFAGSPYKEVDIIDNVGNVLFRVPAIFDRSKINSNSDTGLPIMHITTTATLYSRIHPNQGNAYLKNELENKQLLLHLPENMIEHLHTWNTIFKRYNRPEIVPIEEKNDTAVTKEISIDDFEPF
jgi:hypothetical protein